MEHDKCEFCDVSLVHEDVVRRVHGQMLAAKQREGLGEFFKTLGDPVRIGVLWALSKEEMCVCDLAGLLSMSQSAVSHQLRTLRQARLVQSRRQGKVVYYSLADEHPATIVQTGLEHIQEENG